MRWAGCNLCFRCNSGYITNEWKFQMDRIGNFRTITKLDLETIRAWRNSPEIRNKMYTRHEITEKEHLEWWKNLGNKEKIVYIYENYGTPLGFLSIKFINKEKTVASWAFYSAPEAPNGTGAKMEYLALDFAFLKLRLHRLECEVLASNTVVLRLHQKFGFQLEGTARDRHFDGNSYINVMTFGILAKEWIEKREEMRKKIERL